MNSETWPGFFLPSYCFQVVVFHYFPHPDQYNDAFFIWLHPADEQLVNTTLHSLNIKYIFVSSSQIYFDTYLYDNNGIGGLYKYPYSPSQMINLFDSYSFLTKLYQYGNAAVFRVN